jgi:hypothetical protein
MIEKLMPDGDGVRDPTVDMHYDSPLGYLCIAVLDLCGCGNPEEVAGYVRDGLRRIADADHPDYEDLPAMFFLYWANHKNFADHGTTARCGWLTDEGEELLADLDTVLEKTL